MLSDSTGITSIPDDQKPWKPDDDEKNNDGDEVVMLPEEPHALRHS